MVAARRHMRLPRRLVERVAALLVAVALAACSTTIRDLNLRPERHYQQKVTGVFVPDARVADTNIYDVLTAEEIAKTGAPWLPDLKSDRRGRSRRRRRTGAGPRAP